MSVDESQVLAANQAFYDAFAARKVERLEALLASGDDIAVIHPGWPPLFGRKNVIESWRRILEGPSPPEIRCGEAHATVLGDAAFVICAEHLGEGDLLATNVFRREPDGWRMVHHQAGPAPPPPPQAAGTVH